MVKNFKDFSRENWQRTDGEKPVNEQLQLGCLQRIADATEAMAKNYVQLQTDVEFWKEEYHHEKNRREMFQRSIVAHKANYTRLKNKYSTSPICERCQRQMAGQKFENKITWWTCDSCAKDQDSQVSHLSTCGTAFRGCDPNCPKELAEIEKSGTD